MYFSQKSFSCRKQTFKRAKKKKKSKEPRVGNTALPWERGKAGSVKLSKTICFLPHSLWGDLIVYVDVSFFSSPCFSFLCFSTHGRRWPPKSKNLCEFQILGREDLIGPFGVKWLHLTQSARARKSRCVVQTGLPVVGRGGIVSTEEVSWTWQVVPRVSTIELFGVWPHSI